MEIRLVVISDNGQTTPYEFKSFREASDFCLSKESPEEMSRDDSFLGGVDYIKANIKSVELRDDVANIVFADEVGMKMESKTGDVEIVKDNPEPKKGFIGGVDYIKASIKSVELSRDDSFLERIFNQ